MCESYCTLKLEYSWNNAGFTVTLLKKKFPSNIEQLGRLIDCYTTIYRTIQNISCMTCVVNVPRSQGESLSSSPLSHMHRMDRNGLSGTLLSNGDTWARKNKQTFHYNQDCGSALIFCGSGSNLPFEEFSGFSGVEKDKNNCSKVKNQIYKKIKTKIKITGATNFLAFLLFFFNADQDPGGKMKVDPNPQQWLKYRYT